MSFKELLPYLDSRYVYDSPISTYYDSSVSQGSFIFWVYKFTEPFILLSKSFTRYILLAAFFITVIIGLVAIFTSYFYLKLLKFISEKLGKFLILVKEVNTLIKESFKEFFTPHPDLSHTDLSGIDTDRCNFVLDEIPSDPFYLASVRDISLYDTTSKDSYKIFIIAHFAILFGYIVLLGLLFIFF